MHRGITYSASSAVALALLALTGSRATAGGQNTPLVRLQSATPGTVQTGNLNITGKIITGTLKASSSSANTIFVSNSAAAGMGMESDVTDANAGAVYGNQLATGVGGVLAYGNAGVYGTDAGVASNLAANFDGRVDVTGQRGSVIAGNVFGFSQVMNSPTVSVCIGAPAGNTMAFFTGSTERLRISSPGNVGIGTTNPLDLLSLKGGALSFAKPSDPVPYVGLDYDTPSDSLRFRTNVGSGTLNGTAMAINRTSGNVGIGIAAPTAKFQVVTNMGTGNGYDGGIVFQAANQAQGIGFGYNTIYAAGSNANQDLGMRARGTGRILLNPSVADGNVGVGTDTPSARFHSVGDVAIQANGTSYGVNAFATSDGVAIQATSEAGSAIRATSSGGYGIEANSNYFPAVYAVSTNHEGLRAQSDSTYAISAHGQSGIFAQCDGQGNQGVYAYNNSGAYGYGVVGQSYVGYGVYASGNSGASGTKSFRIDHPLDPLNKYLLHYSAEGPEPRNVYQGTITTDAKGFAWVDLPEYYEAINKDPLIQLTVVDDSEDFVMVKVSQKVKGRHFQIRTSKPAVEVNWRVDAIRNDLWMQKHGAPVEEEKAGREKGKYQQPELYGAPPEMGMNYRPVQGVGKHK